MKQIRHFKAQRIFDYYSEKSQKLIDSGVDDQNIKLLTQMLRRRTKAAKVLGIGLISQYSKLWK